ncbi:hypothetical protein DPSP01_013694 [Paraphaeosphaeria sporulosa]|uniref:Transmembrane protein n=1 Tax=Paraphaeosphaeria sporulosa TaxID=1460663 RepID=A0A177CEF8_9PLEO|nr:uncharacterized protein CC84DRAFT_1176093 [Paraphaeosphaeria sporulosa]OAG06014.1 hypothetical protein CC84DRAFT_1176093 [Paraphaeosphaeria sporulosa]
MTLYPFEIFFLLALVAAVPIPTEAEKNSGGEKYAKDKGAGRPVLSYIFGAAGCLMILGVIYFAWAKYRRGERVCPGVKRKPATRNISRELVKSHRHPAPTSYGWQRPVMPINEAANPYAWPRQQTNSKPADGGYGLRDLNKPLPRRPQNDHGHPPYGVRKPAPILRSGTPVPVVYPNKNGFYTVPVYGSTSHGQDHRYR